MRSRALDCPRTPYGQAFPLEELVFVRDWAIRRGLTMAVLLDQVLDGAEFEELVLLRGGGPRRRALTIWRTAGSVVAQTVGAQPRAFTCMEGALLYYAHMLQPPLRRRSPLMRLLGFFRAR
ncbi:MAG TPA: hypothetical protein VMB71_13720 [Acetobacteraceae bacterium]|nr:hypothetical protein [Acetobacteraceae bacterium]